jgi:hypothetical protein
MGQQLKETTRIMPDDQTQPFWEKNIFYKNGGGYNYKFNLPRISITKKLYDYLKEHFPSIKEEIEPNTQDNSDQVIKALYPDDDMRQHCFGDDPGDFSQHCFFSSMIRYHPETKEPILKWHAFTTRFTLKEEDGENEIRKEVILNLHISKKFKSNGYDHIEQVMDLLEKYYDDFDIPAGLRTADEYNIPSGYHKVIQQFNIKAKGEKKPDDKYKKDDKDYSSPGLIMKKTSPTRQEDPSTTEFDRAWDDKDWRKKTSPEKIKPSDKKLKESDGSETQPGQSYPVCKNSSTFYIYKKKQPTKETMDEHTKDLDITTETTTNVHH